MQVLISDANILIDMEVANLIHLIFQLPYQFTTPDMLYETELKEQHAHLLTLGLQVSELNSESMLLAYQLNERYNQPSLNDIFALVLAKQENCPLLTGDGQLRKSAENESVEVKGTIWLVEQLVIHQIITLAQARQAYTDMEGNRRRLPFKTARDRLTSLGS